MKVQSVSNKLIELEQNKSLIENEILTYNKKLENTNGITISKGDLKTILKNFNEIYDGLSVEIKRRLNQLLFVEITSYVKRNSNDGEIVIKLRADGTLKTDYNSIKSPKDSGSKL